jgi:hypothetical protein
MRRGRSYLAHEERSYLGDVDRKTYLHRRRGGHTLEMWTGKKYLAHEECRSYLEHEERKVIPCT